MLLAYGANVKGSVGEPGQTIAWALRMLGRAGVAVVARSRVYRTAPVGIGRQPVFLNGVVAVRTSIPPAALLRLLKRLERLAGRKFCRGLGSRPLDLDIVAYRGQVISRPHRRRARGSLILPHPEATRRRFVLEPAREIAPCGWRPGGTGGSVGQLLARLPRPPGSLVPAGGLDSLADPCE